MLLKAGPVQAFYHKGFLRYIQTAGHEVVRMIYFAIRNQDWQTIPGTLTEEHIQTTEDTFSVSYTYYVNQDNIQMQWQVTIAGQADGTIIFDLHGLAQSSFLKNRAGFCVLHPITGVSGQPCRLEHPDGSFSYGTFPTFISPHQPFLNLKAMEWPVAEQGVARLEFSGDIFETEDQRNWSDASYKTYCTPLSQPFPARLNTGDQIKQQVLFRLVKPVPVSAVQNKAASALTIHNQAVSFPEIGVGINATGPEPTPEEYTFLQSLGFQHLRADIFLTQAAWPEQVERAIGQSAKLDLPLELALFLGDDVAAEVNRLVSFLQPQQLRLRRILVFEAASRFTTDTLLRTVGPLLRIAFPGVPLGGGSDTNFTEFNRHSFTYTLTDFITYAINPQVHAFDDLSLIENAAAQADTVKSAQHLTGKQPVHLSPITLKPRFNEVATSGQVPSSAPADPRQPSDFIAGWTLASLKYLAEAGAAAITYFETTGPRGIYQSGQPFAVGYLFAYILAFKPEQVLPTTYPEPLKITSLLLLKETTACWLLTNHTPEVQLVPLPENFTVHTPTLIGSATGQSSYLHSLSANPVTLTAYQTIALKGILS